jgi:CRP-like cAMP-binding protein
LALLRHWPQCLAEQASMKDAVELSAGLEMHSYETSVEVSSIQHGRKNVGTPPHRWGANLTPICIGMYMMIFKGGHSSFESPRGGFMGKFAPSRHRTLSAPRLSDSRRNHLLGELPLEDWQALAPWMEVSNVRAGQVLHQEGGQIARVYFPVDCTVALVHALADGASVQTALIGCEGAAGVPVFLGSDTAPSLAVVQTPGGMVAIAAAVLLIEFKRSASFMRGMLRFVEALMAQQAQAVLCSRHHTLEQQLCRWLLLSLDRVQAREFAVTHDLVAAMLGVRRESVTEAVHKLENRGLILGRRGHIHVLDRQGLEQASCECYAVVKHHYEVHLGS